LHQVGITPFLAIVRREGLVRLHNSIMTPLLCPVKTHDTSDPPLHPRLTGNQSQAEFTYDLHDGTPKFVAHFVPESAPLVPPSG
jgi:hypothetical protein